MRARKGLLVLLCVMAIVASTIFGTLAYLTDKDANVNTFTVGKVNLELDEAKVNLQGEPVDNDGKVVDVADAPRVDGNEYHLLPGWTYVKDPTVTVEQNSEDAYVRMIVTVERIDQLKAALPYSEIIRSDDGTTHQVMNPQYYDETGEIFLLQMLCGGWDSATWLFEGYTESTDGKEGYYEFRYKDVVAKSETATKLDDLFETITVPGEIDNSHLAYLDAVNIVVNAHAIQAAGFDTADAAWAQFPTT